MTRRGLFQLMKALPAAIMLSTLHRAMGTPVRKADGVRLSTQPEDPGYRVYASGGLYTAYVDGVRIDRCVMADERLGEAKSVAHDANGNVIVDPKANECVYQWHYGDVEIRARDEFSRKLLRNGKR